MDLLPRPDSLESGNKIATVFVGAAFLNFGYPENFYRHESHAKNGLSPSYFLLINEHEFLVTPSQSKAINQDKMKPP